MSVTLSQIISNTASVTMHIGENTLTIEYYPEAITDEVFILLASLQTVTDSTVKSTLIGFNEALAKLIKSWDAYEDNEKTIMIPLTAERFSQFSVTLKSQILGAIVNDMRPNTVAP